MNADFVRVAEQSGVELRGASAPQSGNAPTISPPE
jgi:hypothetical protein